MKRSKKKKLLALWSKVIRARDKKCMTCSSTKSLQAHHAIVKVTYNNTAFELDNGVGLCFVCHIFKLHSDADPVFMEEYLVKLNKKIPIQTQSRLREHANSGYKLNVFDEEEIEKYLEEKLDDYTKLSEQQK